LRPRRKTKNNNNNNATGARGGAAAAAAAAVDLFFRTIVFCAFRFENSFVYLPAKSAGCVIFFSSENKRV
jgi:hypothetical protein